MEAELQARLFIALALADAEAAHQLYVGALPLPAQGTITVALRVIAAWLARTKGTPYLAEWILARKYHVEASEWLAAAASARALAAADLERVALELSTRIETWLDPFSWRRSIEPLAHVAAATGSIPVIESLCHRYLPPGDRLVTAMVGGVTELASLGTATVDGFVERLAQSAPFAEAFDPPADLQPAPWDAMKPAWIELLDATSAPPPPAERRGVALDVLRLAGASPIPPDTWRPLGALLSS